MTHPTGDDPSRPAAFDFGLGSPSGSGAADQPLTRRSARRASVDSRPLAVPLTIALVIVALVGGAAFAGWYLVKTSEDEVKADSAAFCAALAETPGSLQQPGFGWPTGGKDLASTLELMKGYQSQWESIAAAAPPTVTKDAVAVAAAAGIITTGIEQSKSIDRLATLTSINAVTSKTAIPAWSEKYCD